MPVGAREVVCPSCEDRVDVTLSEDRTIVDIGAGHRDADRFLNQLCTSCLEQIHVEVE